MAIGQSNERLAAVRKNYPDDELLIAACDHLFNLFENEEELKREIKVSNGAWVHFLQGKSRQGVRLALIHRAARTAIHDCLLGKMPNECKKV